MVTVGQALTAPEAGWKRYDDTDSNIIYSGSWGVQNYESFYQGQCRWSNSPTSEAHFNFSGTKIRLIGATGRNNNSTDSAISVDVYVDGGKYTVPQAYDDGVYQGLWFEITGLENKEHSIKITFPNIGSGRYFYLDAIDIDENGEIKPYNPTPVGSDQAILRVTMIDSSEREYKLPKAEIDGFISWFTRTIGTGTTVYVLNKMTGSKDYLAFDKIISFEVIPVA